MHDPWPQATGAVSSPTDNPDNNSQIPDCDQPWVPLSEYVKNGTYFTVAWPTMMKVRWILGSVILCIYLLTAHALSCFFIDAHHACIYYDDTEVYWHQCPSSLYGNILFHICMQQSIYNYNLSNSTPASICRHGRATTGSPILMVWKQQLIFSSTLSVGLMQQQLSTGMLACKPWRYVMPNEPITAIHPLLFCGLDYSRHTNVYFSNDCYKFDR